MSDRKLPAAVALGRRGGKAGTGKSKRRGNAAYYRKLAKLSAEAKRAKKESPCPAK